MFHKLLATLLFTYVPWVITIPNPVRAQQEPDTAQQDPGNPEDHELNIELRLALCVQDWDRAVGVLNKMEKIFPQYGVRLNAYRASITVFRNSDADVPDWPPMEYCAGSVDEVEEGN